MTEPTAATDPSQHPSVSEVTLSRWGLITGFALVHLWIVLGALARSGEIWGDVTLYAWWARRGIETGWWPVLDEAWVYPAGALVPVTLPALGTAGFVAYATVWSVMVIALNGVATWMLARTGQRGRTAAAWWLVFLAALGPIWLGRLDGVSEVIMATNPDVEGEATAMYIARLLKPLGVKVTRIAQGISMGSDIEYADEITLSKALDARTEI